MGRFEVDCKLYGPEKRTWPFPAAIWANCRDGHIVSAYRQKGVAPTQRHSAHDIASSSQPLTSDCISLDLTGDIGPDLGQATLLLVTAVRPFASVAR
jgi:hypothetical protein